MNKNSKINKTISGKGKINKTISGNSKLPVVIVLIVKEQVVYDGEDIKFDGENIIN